MSSIEGVAPSSELPNIWGGYNAVGLSEDSGDNCIYSLHRDELNRLDPENGMAVFVYEDDVSEDGENEVLGYMSNLEYVPEFTGQWRARPIEGSWYRGPKSW